jgi:thiamine biosynthesis lipoprotein
LSTDTRAPDRPAGQAIYRTSVWSTRVDLVVTDPGVLVAATRILHRELDWIDQLASRFRDDSELSALNRAAGAGVALRVSDGLLEAITVALRAASLTDGAVDPTVGAAMCRLGYDRDFSEVAPGRAGPVPEPRPLPGWRSVTVDDDRAEVGMPVGTVLDLGATAKAWAADRVSTAIRSGLGCGVLVSLGGDIAAVGAPQGGFHVGIADICGDPSAPVTVSISSGGLATSGIGNRRWTLGGEPMHHLVDPGTGLPVVPYWKTVSVAAGSCVDANTASTAAMVKGEGADHWLGERGLPARLVHLDGSTVTVANWPDDPEGLEGPPPFARPVQW